MLVIKPMGEKIKWIFFKTCPSKCTQKKIKKWWCADPPLLQMRNTTHKTRPWGKTFGGVCYVNRLLAGGGGSSDGVEFMSTKK